MPSNTVRAIKTRMRTLKGLVALVLCASFVLPQVFAPRAAKASAISAPKAAPPEAFLFHTSSSVRIDLLAKTSDIAGSILEVINGPAIPDGLEVATVPSFAERLGSAMASIITTKAAPQPASPPQPNGSVDFDFDNDGKADIGRWRSSGSEFKIRNSSSGTIDTYVLGSANSKSTPGDFDGDSKTDAAVFNAGTWTIRKSSTGTNQTINYGMSGDIPVTGDYDGDAISDAAIYRPSTGTWWTLYSSNGQSPAFAFGIPGDIPAAGNYDGDTRTDFAVFRPSTGDWHVYGSTSGYSVFHWGVASDIPAPADYDGDGKTDFAVYRGSTGTWYVYYSNPSLPYTAQVWGNYGDQPVPADYDGDGKADFAVWRPTNGVWYIKKSSDGLFDYHTLGSPGDMAVSSSYLKQIGGSVSGYSLAKARLSPKNATGGTNLYSQNFSWGTSLVGLPGRAGLDAGFGISYNSLVWTKDGTSIHFDTNQDNVSPGFRLGFSTIEPVYYDTVTQKWNYLMVTPSGGRIEFRQTAASDTYETADSSYLQMKTQGASNPNDPVENITITVRGTDGTAMTYLWKAGAFHCSQIKDRNGNIISINHDNQGILRTVTDTLGRVITVEYDSSLYPTAIKQTWKSGNGDGSDVTHTWASFSYTTREITTDFGSLTVFGPSNGTSVRVLERVTFADNSSTRFTHNAYGQLSKVANHAADGHELNYTSTNLDSVSGVQSDCPRFTETRSTVENFNNGQPVVVTNSYTENQPIPGGGATGTLVTVANPDGVTPSGVVITKAWFSDTGWSLGLPFYSETCTTTACEGTDKKKWSWSTWTQDDTNLLYILNPRMTSTVVSDWTSSRKTEIDYYVQSQGSSISYYGLAKEIRTIDAYNNNILLKKNEITYNNDPAYISRRIIGLPAQTLSHGRNDLTQSLELVSQGAYSYDQGDFGDSTLNQNILPVQHDSSTYGASFVIGRGNLTSTTRHDVLGQSAAVTSTVKYNTAGAPVAQIDPMSRVLKIRYADNWNGSGDPANTFAYPTSITDPVGNSSTVKYRYDIGANVRAQSPAPQGQSQGKITERYFDSVGRLEKELIVNSGAYSRYEYPSNGIQSKVYSTIIDTNNNGTGDAADEVMSESWFDGVGRVLRSRTEHPGSAGGWSATIAEYDILGRAARQSVPTEVSVSNPNDPNSWQAAGDDATRGFLWTRQKYDWKGRVVRKINTDGADSPTLNDSDVLISYEGCGCAGGQVTSVQGESVPRDDQPGIYGRRTQKVYEDILGRTWKTVVMKWDGTTPYTTTEQHFNGRDQVLESRQIDNTSTTSPQASQLVTMTYDGHGRLATQHLPQQDANANTSFAYNADDSVSVKTDGRGATATMTYNERGLVTQIDNVLPVATPTPSPTPTPPPTTTSNYTPIGQLDGVNESNASAVGWSLDPDNPNASNVIHFYIGGPPGTGTYIGQTVADRPRPDVNTNTGYSGNHGFEFQIPEQYLYGSVRIIYAYGLDTGSNNPTHLNGSPKLFNLLRPSVPPPVNTTTTFAYDAAGNRTSMTDSMGSQTYEYNALSQMTAEMRQFNETFQEPPPNNQFKLEYEYQISGAIKSLTDPFDHTIEYGYDDVGRLKAVTGTGTGNANYASNAQYRAWGGLKGLDYGNGVEMSTTFNSRLLPDHYELVKDTTNLLKKSYEYLNDGSLRYLQDQLNDKFDRLNTYDHVGRIKEAKSGLEARGGTVTTNLDQNLAYRQSYQFNAFGNMTQRLNLHWGVDEWYGQSNNLGYNYQNNRITNFGWLYDADGRVTKTADPEDSSLSTYDARGLITVLHTQNEATQSIDRHFYSGDGLELKRMKRTFTEDPEAGAPIGDWRDESPIYYIRSTVLGGEVVTEVSSVGSKKKTFVIAAGARIATQNWYPYNSTPTQSVYWEHFDASGTSYRSTKSNGTVATGSGQFVGGPAELDPMGANAGISTPYIEPVQPPEPSLDFPFFPMLDDDLAYVDGRRVPCEFEGITIGCSRADSLMRGGAAMPESLGRLQHLPGFRFDSYGLGIYSFSYTIRGNSNAPPPPGAPTPSPNVVPSYGTPDRTVTEYFSLSFTNISWEPQTQTKDVTRVVTDIRTARTKLTQRCIDNLRDFLSGAIKKKFGLKEGSDELRYFEDSVLGLGAMLDSLSRAAITSSAVHRSEHVTDAIYNDRTIATFTSSGGSTSLNVGTKYFYDIVHNSIRSNNDPRYSLSSRSEKERIYTILHEAIHSVVLGFSDEFFAEYISNGKTKETDEDAFKKGSLALTEKLKELCP